jgi:UDP-N-acetylmuramate dehydrogenase
VIEGAANVGREPLNIHLDAALGPYNTLALQARAAAFATVTGEAQVSEAIAWARARRWPIVPLGEGSNVVFAGDVTALLVRQETRGIQVLQIEGSNVVLRVAAGENWHALVQWTLARGYYGLENLALIPGTVGAAPIQNIGAYGVELQSVLLRVHARLIASDEPVTLDQASCELAYRDSIFKRELKDKLVITAIDLRLSLRPRVLTTYAALASFFQQHPHIEPTPEAVFDAVVSIRRSKLPDPAMEPNAGSFFKNPLVSDKLGNELRERFPFLPTFPQSDGRVKLAAAWMIEHCGWKGLRRDNLGVHRHHALVLVNYGNDSGQQLLALAEDIAASVYNSFQVHLEIEPAVYGART